MQCPADESKVRLSLSNNQPVDISSVFARATEQVSQLQAVNSVFFDLDFPDDVRRARVVRRAIVRVPVARYFHRAGDIAQFNDVCQFLGIAVGGDVLNDDRRIGRQTESFGRDLNPPDVALFCREFERVDVGSGEEASRDIAGECDFLA